MEMLLVEQVMDRIGWTSWDGLEVTVDFLTAEAGQKYKRFTIAVLFGDFKYII